MLKIFLLTAALTPAPVLAAELWCMPDKICTNDKCQQNTDTESSVRLRDPDGAKPVMRAYAEDIAVTKSETKTKVQWYGVSNIGTANVSMTLAMRKSDLKFTLDQSGAFGEIVSTGQCEVQ